MFGLSLEQMKCFDVFADSNCRHSTNVKNRKGLFNSQITKKMCTLIY